MIDVVFAMGTAFVEVPNGIRAKVMKGSHWPKSDPIVRARPELFSEDPRWGMFYTEEPAGYDAPVETASAVPGERRSTRRSA